MKTLEVSAPLTILNSATLQPLSSHAYLLVIRARESRAYIFQI